MIWLFVILGLCGMASALYGLGRASSARRGLYWQIASVGLFVVAWVLGHEQGGGWVVLILALLATITGSLLRRRGDESYVAAQATPRHTSERSIGEAVTDENAEKRADADELSRGESSVDSMVSEYSPFAVAPPLLVSWVLLSKTWQFVPDVFLASLRRAGERSARLDGPITSGAARFAIGRLLLEVEYFSGAAPAKEIAEAISQSWDWPEAASTVRTHAARVRFTTRVERYAMQGENSRPAILRLHGLAHRALAEFAPACANWWPGAARLLSPDTQPRDAGDERPILLAAATAVSFRTLPLDGDLTGHFVCDSMGLDTLGLLDIQVSVEGEPDESVSRALYALAARQVERNEVPEEGMPWPSDGSPRWRLRRGPACFGRPREVLLLVPLDEEEESAGAVPEASPTT